MIVVKTAFSTIMMLVAISSAAICALFLYFAYTGNAEGLAQFASDSRGIMNSFESAYRNIKSAL